MRCWVVTLSFMLFLSFSVGVAFAETPNIVYILADDMGTGDVSSLNPDSKISTPNIDRITRAGMYFSDAHSGSGICTPTRYGILTGRYAWRTRVKRGVLWGYGRHLIEPSRMTVASLLKAQGYDTACIGKWHLGMDMAIRDGKPISAPGVNIDVRDFIADVDWRLPIENGPNSVGFDYFFGISASLDMHPYIYIENDRFVGECTTTKDMMQNLNRAGPAHEDFESIDVLPEITRRTVEHIESRSKDRPFFIYMPLTAPHIPLVPSEEYRGRSPLGTYGDFVIQVDETVGAVLDALDRKGFAENTLVIFAADNGGAHYVGAAEMEEMGHYTNFVYRGYKADAFEGGHRIPFIVRWPGKVKAGSRSDETICLTDLLATCASIVGTELPNDAGEDSFTLLPALLGSRLEGPLREATVHHSGDGTFAIRKGKWKLELGPGSGGWSAPTNAVAKEQHLPPIQLYNLELDIAETINVFEEHRDVVSELTVLLDKYKTDGRSAPLR